MTPVSKPSPASVTSVPRNTAQLSFVIPAHNVEPYLVKCFDSILSGGSDEIEVIVVDDASTDGSRDVIAKIADDDARVRLLIHDTPQGAGLSRNHGLAAAAGEYVWFVDADDWLFDAALGHVLGRLDGNIDVLFVNHVQVWEDGRPNVAGKSSRVLARAPSTEFTLRDWPEIASVLPVPWNKIVKRSLLVEHAVAYPVGVGSDIAYTFQVLPAAKHISVEQFVCYAWRTGRPGQLTRVRGKQHFVVSDHWRAALDSCADEPMNVQAAVFNRMIATCWNIIADDVRLGGHERREFFLRFSALYRERHRAGLPRDPFLASGSWALAQMKVLPRRVRALVPPNMRLMDRTRSLVGALRRWTTTRNR